MAITNKAAIQALIDAYTANITLYITSNNNKEITGAQLKQILDESSIILEDLKDSYFNLLDEPRTALSVNYTNVGNPLNWNGGIAPATQNLVNDELAQRMTTLENIGISLTTAYVDENGDDLTAELGVETKPFASFAAARDALPVNNCRIVCTGGAFTEDVIITGKQNFFLSCTGSTITGSFRFTNCFDSGADFTGTEVISTTANVPIRFGGGNIFTVRGGKFATATSVICTTGDNAFFLGSQFVATGVAVAINLINSRLVLCTASSTGGGSLNKPSTVWGCTNCFFSFCSFTNSGLGKGAYTTQQFNTFYDCLLQSDGDALQGESNTGLEGKFVDCDIISLSAVGVNLNGASDKLKITGGKIVSGTDCVILTANTIRPATTTNIISGVEMHAGSGNIFNEPTYNVSDLGILLSINNTYNKTFVPTAKIIEHNKFEYLGLQDI